MPSAPTRTRTRGFSLIEVTMAAAILSVGAAAVLGAYSTTMGLIEHQRRLSAAVNVTQSKLEDLLVASSTSPLLAPGANGPDIVDALGRAPIGGETYEVRWTIETGVPSPGYISVVVETTWAETRGPRFTRFAAYRAD